jgi:hypothetical protein
MLDWEDLKEKKSISHPAARRINACPHAGARGPQPICCGFFVARFFFGFFWSGRISVCFIFAFFFFHFFLLLVFFYFSIFPFPAFFPVLNMFFKFE